MNAVRKVLRIKSFVSLIAALAIASAVRTATPGNAAVYLFESTNGGTASSAASSGAEPITLKSTCIINFAPGTSGKTSLLSLIKKNCLESPGGWASKKFPVGTGSYFYFTTKVKVTLEVGGAQGGPFGGKGGVTGLSFVFDKEDPMAPFVIYVIGKKGKTVRLFDGTGGGGGSMIVLAPAGVGMMIYPDGTTSAVPKDKVIAVIAGGGGGTGRRFQDGTRIFHYGLPGKGGRTTGDHGDVALRGGNCHSNCDMSNGGYGGGGNSQDLWAMSIDGGGGGGGYYGGEGNGYAGYYGGYGGGAYCSFFGEDSSSSGCYGGDGQNSGDGYGFIKLEPIP